MARDVHWCRGPGACGRPALAGLSYSALSPRSPLRIRTALSMDEMKILPSPIFPDSGGIDDGVDDPLELIVRDDQFQFDLGTHIDVVLGAPIGLGVTFLPAVAMNLGDGKSIHPGAQQTPP